MLLTSVTITTAELDSFLNGNLNDNVFFKYTSTMSNGFIISHLDKVVKEVDVKVKVVRPDGFQTYTKSVGKIR